MKANDAKRLEDLLTPAEFVGRPSTASPDSHGSWIRYRDMSGRQVLGTTDPLARIASVGC
jgi:hypothetical protein